MDNGTITRPTSLGERTGRQTDDSISFGGLSIIMPDLLASPGTLPGSSRGTFPTYRRMRSNPTIALARMAATAPLRAVDWSYVEPDTTGDGTRAAFVESVIEPLRAMLMKEVMRALDYGFQSFEKVWEVKDGLLVYDKIKPLLPDKTTIVVDKQTGAFAGLKQGKVELTPAESFLFTYDGEAGDHYGRSRMENVREQAWEPWLDALDKTKKYTLKAAGVIPIVRYPLGEQRDKSGSKTDTKLIADQVAAGLAKGHGVVMPMQVAQWARDIMQRGGDVSKMMAWKVDFFDARVGHGKELLELMRQWESLMARGWLVPERAILEGQFGTKAEASAHIDVALTIASELMDDVMRSINKWIVDPLLALNFGTDAKGSVVIEPGPIVNEDRVFFRDLLKAVLSNPANIDLLLRLLDFDAALTQAGLPAVTDSKDELKSIIDEVAGGGAMPTTSPVGAP